MKLTADDIIKELYETTPDYQIYTLEQFSEICLMPLTFFKKKMKGKDLPTMRFKNFGMFTVFPGIIAKLLHYNRNRLNKGVITQETYDIFSKEMEEVQRQLQQPKYVRGKVNIIYYDESFQSPTTLPEEQSQD